MLNNVVAGKIDRFVLEIDRNTRFETNSHERVNEFLQKFKPQGVIYFTRILTDAGEKEEQTGYSPETSIGQMAWKYTCKCGETEWRTAELSQELADHFLCSFCDND